MRALIVAAFLVAPAAADPCKPLAGSFTINFDDEQSLDSFATWITEKTCTKVVFAPEIDRINTRVTILAPKKVTAKRAVAMFVDAVEATGHVVTNKGGTVTVARGKTQPVCANGGITAKDAWTYEVDLLVFQAEIVDPVVVAKSVRFVPNISNGKPAGYKLYAIRPGSVPARLGFENGDNVQRINGVAVDDPSFDRAAVALSAKIVVEIVRRGKPVTLTYSIR